MIALTNSQPSPTAARLHPTMAETGICRRRRQTGRV